MSRLRRWWRRLRYRRQVRKWRQEVDREANRFLTVASRATPAQWDEAKRRASGYGRRYW